MNGEIIEKDIPFGGDIIPQAVPQDAAQGQQPAIGGITEGQISTIPTESPKPKRILTPEEQDLKNALLGYAERGDRKGFDALKNKILMERDFKKEGTKPEIEKLQDYRDRLIKSGLKEDDPKVKAVDTKINVSKTTEQIVAGSLREKFGREPTDTEIDNALRQREVEKAKAGAIAREEGTTKVYSEKAKRIGDQIIAGKIPPDITGFGMGKLRTELLDYFASKEFDYTTSMLDYSAIKKHVQTLNGPQQLRLRQAVKFTYDSLDVIENLNKQWRGGRFPLLNSANLMAAVNGAYGKEAQKIATKLNTQIADLTSELAIVYRGGNASTDESLKLAAENLKAKWSWEQLESNIELVRTNLEIRKNSIEQTLPGGVKGTIYEKGKPPEKEKKEIRRGKEKGTGKTVIQYSDGSMEYAD